VKQPGSTNPRHWGHSIRPHLHPALPERMETPGNGPGKVAVQKMRGFELIALIWMATLALRLRRLISKIGVATVATDT
jgi:hypothetical protein